MPYVVQLYIKLSPHILYTLTFCGVHTWHTWHFHILWLYIHLKGIPVAPTSIALFYIHWRLLYTYKAPLTPTEVGWYWARNNTKHKRRWDIYSVLWKDQNWSKKLTELIWNNKLRKFARKNIWNKKLKNFQKISWTIKCKICNKKMIHKDYLAFS